MACSRAYKAASCTLYMQARRERLLAMGTAAMGCLLLRRHVPVPGLYAQGMHLKSPYAILAVGGKQVVLFGGVSPSHEGAATETAVLHLDTLQWERPESAKVCITRQAGAGMLLYGE